MPTLATLIDTEAERMVIGSLLIDGDYWGQVREALAPEDFHDGELRTVYRAMNALAERGVPIEPMTVFWEMQAVGGDDMKKASILAHSASLPVTPCHARTYAARVHDMAERRRMFVEAQNLAGKALDKSKPVAAQGRAKGGIEI